MSRSLRGKYIVFTGKLEDFTRADLQQMAHEYGFTFQKSVTGTTDIVVKGERPGAEKIAKASKLGKRIMPAEDFLHLLDLDEDMGMPEPTVVASAEEIEERLGYYRENADAGIF